MTYLLDMSELDSLHSQRNTDRLLGYFIIAGIILVACSIVGLGLFHLKNPTGVRAVVFDQVGNLKTDDPVFLLGIRIGSVKSIELRKENVLVSFSVNKPLKLHQGYRIDDRDVGLMGDRMLMIDFGDSTKPLIPDTDTLSGKFYPGISEAVGMAWKLKDVIDSFIDISARLLDSGSLRTSFVKRVNEIAAVTDSATRALADMVAGLESDLPPSLDSLNAILEGILRFSRLADSLSQQKVSGVLRQVGLVGDGLQKLAVMIDKLDALIEKLGPLIAKVKVLRDAVLHLKEGFMLLKNIAIEPK
jgi:ABC-type transporter Mla subunit MlaD